MGQLKSRRQLLRTLGAGSVLGVAGCIGDGGTTSSDSDTTIRMGVLSAQSGELSTIGQSIVDSITLATDQVNDANNGITVDIQVEDTETDPLVGASRAEDLADEGYPMICGPLRSNVSQQVVSEVAVPRDIVVCSPVSTAPSLAFLEDNRLFFRTAPDDSLQGQALASITSERLENSSAAVLHVNDTYGKQLSESFVQAFEGNFGGTVNSTVSFESGRPTYVPPVQSAMSGDPDTLLLIAFPESGAQILSDFNRSFQTEDVDILVSNGNQYVNFPENVDPSNIGGTSPGANGPGLEFFNEQYQQAYGREPSIFNEHAYDAAATLMLAHARAEEPSGEALRNNIWWNTDDRGEAAQPETLSDGIETAAGGGYVAYNGVSGVVEFNRRGGQTSAVYNYFQYRGDGSLEPRGKIEV